MGTVRYSAGPSREAEKQPLLFKEESLHSREGDRELPSTVSRATARSQAIQKKRKEIERVYRQDCDTFGLVVKMLIDKDPSLDRPIQSSLKQNLQEIGLRCVEAMQQFIEDYDTREPPPSVTHRPLAQTKHKQTDISYQAQKCNSVCKLIG
ncbi:hypothetical protein UPYG_G00014540 [Umbra pygmaea]|uniref:Periphilin-1 C-terminal domain-containing protein n=1 Tax=Umbra pygmaea TaxID=75934 RepID=A0ABD0XJC2_UMBPY